MAHIPRRRFLQSSLKTAAGCSATVLLRNSLFVRASQNATTRVYLDSRRALAPLDRNIFGSFLEHLGRAIYEGIYEPDSKLADSTGFRKDVADEIRHLGVPMVRYPGGNFVSGYHWLEGVGSKKDRPRILEKAWNSIETNQFGTNEFMAWCKLVGAKPLMGLNLGTSTPEMAGALVEYCNVEKGTKWSELRRSHGYVDAYKVENWCLGNEMDGPWQIGHMTATEYGIKAADAGRQMRYVDPSLKLIACGSSGPFMPTYLEWDREVLEHCYQYVDGISLHRYFSNGNADETGGDSTKFMSLNLSMDRQIAQIEAVCDYVQGRLRSPKKLWLSFDEWNVWYRERSGDGKKQIAPHLLEEIYNLEDALLVGGLINSIIRNSDRVRVACLAQLVNVIAPIMTNATGLYRQTIYYPYAWALQYAHGSALSVAVESASYEVSGVGSGSSPRSDFASLGLGGSIPYVDAAATLDQSGGRYSVFLFNRDLANSREVELVWEDGAPSRVLESFTLTGNDLRAHNSFEAPQNVAPKPFDKPATNNNRTRLQLPSRSYTVLHLAA